MKALFPISLAIMVSACETVPDLYMVQMPLELLREEGQAPRLGATALSAGSYDEDSAFSFRVSFEPENGHLGKPTSVGWTVRFRDYCNNEPIFLQSALIGPSGDVWHGFRVFVPAGPDRTQDWSSGSTGAIGPDAGNTDGLLEAMAAGGRFTLALEESGGERKNVAVIDTLKPAMRERLFEDNKAAVLTADPKMPVTREPMLMVVEAERITQQSPPLRCP